MHTGRRRLGRRGRQGLVAGAVGAVGLLVACGSTDPAGPPAQEAFRALVFSKTTGFRHASIPHGQALLRELGAREGFGVDVTEDADVFLGDLGQYAAIVFLNTTGDPLNDAQQAAFQAYIRAGGGYVGVHSASDTEHDWPWYGELVGAWFVGHPPIQDALIDVEDASHPSTRHLPAVWARRDEWYNFDRNPRADVQVLLALREDTYEGGYMSGDHPAAWFREFDGGRSWYTAGGHTEESYAEPTYVQHLLGGLLWAAGQEP